MVTGFMLFQGTDPFTGQPEPPGYAYLIQLLALLAIVVIAWVLKDRDEETEEHRKMGELVDELADMDWDKDR